MQAGPIIAGAFLVLIGGYMIHRSVAVQNVVKRLKQAVGSTEAQVKRMEEAISVTRESIIASQENTDAVREQTAAIRQLIEMQKQNRS